jgi:cytoskeleton protein RodZ
VASASTGSPATVGARLRAAREKRGISLRQIAERTRISVMVLEAVERDDIKRLPGGIFTRSFLRSYATEVGLDPDTTVDEFLAQFPPESVTAGTVGDPVEDHQAIESDRHAARTFVRLIAASLPIAAIVIYFTVRPTPSGEETESSAPSSVEAPTVAGGSKILTPSRGNSKIPPATTQTVKASEVKAVTAIEPKPTTDPKAAITPKTVTDPKLGAVGTGAAATVTPPTTGGNQATATMKPSATDATPVPTEVKVPAQTAKRPETAKPAAPPDSVMMVIDQPSRCWVAVAVDGQAVAPERLGSGERLELKARREIVVTVGEDSPCSYTLNGAAGRPLGQPGAIVTRRISPDNYRSYVTR